MKTSLPQATLIKKIIKENYKIKTFITDTTLKKAKPGQFIMVWLPGKGEKPFSIVDDNPLTFTVAKVGNFTKNLHRLKSEEKIWFRGPLGRGVFRKIGKNYLLVGGGYGVAPLYFLTKKILNPQKSKVLIGGKTKKDIIFKNKFEKLGIKPIIVTEDGSEGKKGLLTDYLEEIFLRNNIDCLYACGPLKMLEKIAKICEKKKIKYQLSLEAIIKCGIGVCGSCSIQGKLICKDGPVFNKWFK